MLKDMALIGMNFRRQLAVKFGDGELTAKVETLIRKISHRDRFVDAQLYPSLMNILELDEREASCCLDMALRLSEASAFAPVLYLEKIPTLIFYDLSDDVGNFLLNVLDFGARAVSMFLGSDNLRTEDLIDILEQSSVRYYRTLLRSVTERHGEFGVNCAVIMRFAAKIGVVVPEEKIAEYLDVCSHLSRSYGANVAEQFVRHTHELLPMSPLAEVPGLFRGLRGISLLAVEFAVTNPKAYFMNPNLLSSSPSSSSSSRRMTRTEKVEALENEHYTLLLQDPSLDEDKNFSSLLLFWPNASRALKENVLFQLKLENYKESLLDSPPMNEINAVTNSRWMEPWLFCGHRVELSSLRAEISQMLRDPALFSLPSKTIVNRNRSLFDRSNPQYSGERLCAIAEILREYCKDPRARIRLEAMIQFLSVGDRIPLRNALSREQMVVEACERRPWLDYGRADELFSCTGIGQYAADNSPGFLADLNLVNLDIWGHDLRIGRIHLCLVKNTDGETVLLLDCVDGSDRITEGQKKFRFILDAVFSYAAWLGVGQVKINCDVDFNTTPKKFISFIEESFENAGYVEFMTRFLSNRSENILMPYPLQTFLESFQKYHSAFVKGPLIQVSDYQRGRTADGRDER